LTGEGRGEGGIINAPTLSSPEMGEEELVVSSDRRG